MQHSCTVRYTAALMAATLECLSHDRGSGHFLCLMPDLLPPWKVASGSHRWAARAGVRATSALQQLLPGTSSPGPMTMLAVGRVSHTLRRGKQSRG